MTERLNDQPSYPSSPDWLYENVRNRADFRCTFNLIKQEVEQSLRNHGQEGLLETIVACGVESMTVSLNGRTAIAKAAYDQGGECQQRSVRIKIPGDTWRKQQTIGLEENRENGVFTVRASVSEPIGAISDRQSNEFSLEQSTATVLPGKSPAVNYRTRKIILNHHTGEILSEESQPVG